MTRRNPGVEADTTTQWARVLTEEEAAAELTRLQEEAEPERARSGISVPRVYQVRDSRR